MNERYTELRQIVSDVATDTLRKWLQGGFARTPDGKAVLQDELAARGDETSAGEHRRTPV